MYEHGSLLALFLFPQVVQRCGEQKQICGSPHAVWNGNPYGAIPFLLPEMPAKALPHERLDKTSLRNRREKERWKEK